MVFFFLPLRMRISVDVGKKRKLERILTASLICQAFVEESLMLARRL